MSLYLPDSIEYGSVNGRTVVDFPQPWLDYASTAIPNNLTLVLRWAEFIWMSNGTYRQAMQRTARYFITDLAIKDIDDDQATDIKDIFENDLKIYSFLSQCGDNFLCYGNVFIVRHIPFKRFLQCECGFSVPYQVAHERNLYTWEEWEFKKHRQGCPNCKSTKPWTIKDVQDQSPERLQLLIMNPHEIEIAYNPYSQKKKYYWNLPIYLVNGIREGIPIYLESTPEEIINAAKSTRRLEIYDSVIFHAAEPAPAGFYTGGWGLPRVISNFRLAYHYQVLNRYDQAMAMDYINGMRVISPAPAPSAQGAGDPLLALGSTMFKSVVQNMVALHRRDPASWHISPFPLQYQLFGGEGRQLSPKDLMEYKLNEWLDASGVPQEFFHGNLSVQAAPMALRVFEMANPEIRSLYNNILEWIAAYLMQVMDVPKFRVEILKPRIIDDLERRHILLQLMGGNQISPQTALQAFGITNPREEIRRSFEWQQMAAEEEKKFQEEMQRAAESETIRSDWAMRSQAAMGVMPPGSQPPPGAGAPPSGASMPPVPAGGGAPPMAGAGPTPESLLGEADRIAQQILQMDPTSRRRTLIDLKHTNPMLHPHVKAKLEAYEQQAKMTGVQMLRSGQIPPQPS